MIPKTVATCIAQRLAFEGVETVFTVPGEQLDALFGALANTGIHVMHARHEQGAAFMAYGYARSTGRIGVHACISGPGVLHSAAGLALGYSGDARMLCLAGQVATPTIGRGYGVPHEIPDQLGILQRLTGWAGRIESPRQADAVLSQAFHRLRTGRPRPVAVEIPADVLAAEVGQADMWIPPSPEGPVDQAPLDAALGKACELLTSAQAPLIFAGSGARESAAEVALLAELLQAPVTSEMGGRGVVPDDHALAISLPTAHRLWPRVDVVLAIGTRLMRPQVQWGLDDQVTVIRVDVDPEEISRVAEPAVGIVADASVAVRGLIDGLAGSAKPDGRSKWLAEIEQARQEVNGEIAKLVPQVDYLRAIRGALPDDGFLVDELTQVGYAARIAFPILRPYTYVISTYQGGLGFGFAAALGVQAANPGKPVLSISGDGGFLYTGNELATAILHRLPVVAVIFTDDSFANIARSQRALFGGTVATDLHNPDFVRYAEAFGARGLRAQSPADLQHAITLALSRPDLPTVIEVPVGDMPSPWPLIRLPQVR